MKTVILLFLILAIGVSDRTINYPVKLTYVNIIKSWREPSHIAEGMGIPGYGADHGYNYIVLAFWRYNKLWDFAEVWNNPQAYLFSEFGNTKEETQTEILRRYH